MHACNSNLTGFQLCHGQPYALREDAKRPWATNHGYALTASPVIPLWSLRPPKTHSASVAEKKLNKTASDIVKVSPVDLTPQKKFRLIIDELHHATYPLPLMTHHDLAPVFHPYISTSVLLRPTSSPFSTPGTQPGALIGATRLPRWVSCAPICPQVTAQSWLKAT